MRVELPESFEKRMQEMLGMNTNRISKVMITPDSTGLRINPMKITEEELAEGPVFLWIRSRGQRPGIFIKKKISRPDIHITVPVFIICRSQVP